MSMEGPDPDLMLHVTYGLAGIDVELVTMARPSEYKYARIATAHGTFYAVYCTISLQCTVLYCIAILAPGG